MIEIKGNALIITVSGEKEKAIFNDIINFYIAKTNEVNCGDEFLKLADEYRQIDKNIKFNREELYNEDSRFH